MHRELKKSRFIIATKNQFKKDEYLVYNTHTTAFVILNEDKFNEIFEHDNYSDEQTIDALVKMGFLVNRNVNELELLDSLRRKAMDDPVQNATILTTTNCNARCYYCFESGIDRYDMTEETADAVIRYHDF